MWLNEVNPIVTQVVPDRVGDLQAPFWFTVDPESHLVTSVYGEGCDLDPREYMEWELLADDFMKTADVLANPHGVQTLHGVTDGRPERSPIYVEVMVPNGMAQELLVALRSSSGEPWGTTRLNRAPGDPMFSPHEIRFMAVSAPLLAEGVRRGLLVGEAIEPDLPDAPGLVVISIDALSSEWVQKEVRMALEEVEKRGDGYKVISVVLPGVQPGILKLLFPKEPVHIFIQDKPTGFREAMPKVFAALGHQLPNDWESAIEIQAEPVEELILELTDPTIEEMDGVRRATATAQLTYHPENNSRATASRRS